MAMGTIRMVMLDNLSVSDLLVLKAGGFFTGTVVPLTSGVPTGLTISAEGLPPPVVEQRVPPRAPVVAEPAPTEAPVVEAPPVLKALKEQPLPPDQEALLEQFKREAAEYRAEKAEAGEPIPEVETPAPVAAPTLRGPVTVDQLSTCTKLRDVLQLLLDGGMAAAELTGYLEGVREQVPLLQRISNIGDRVSRTLSVMGVA